MKKAKVSKYGQWKYPGQDTIIPNANGSITMKGVPYPVLGIDDQGNQQMMMPGVDYQFPGNSVYEIPMMAAGGMVNPCPPGKVPDGKGNCVDDLTTPPIPTSSLYNYYTTALSKYGEDNAGKMVKQKRQCKPGDECWEEETKPVEETNVPKLDKGYYLIPSGNPGVAVLNYRENAGNGKYISNVLGPVHARDFLNDDQQRVFFSPQGGTTTVDYDPNTSNIKIYPSAQEAWKIIDDEVHAPVRKNQQQTLIENTQRIEAEKERLNAPKPKTSESLKFEYGGDISVPNLKQVKIKSLPKAQDIGTFNFDKYAKLKSFELNNLPLEEQDQYFRNMKLANKQLDHLYGVLYDERNGLKTVIQPPTMSDVNAELGSSDIQYSYDGEIPYVKRFNKFHTFGPVAFTGELPEVRIPSGKRYSQNYIDWNNYDPQLRDSYFKTRDEVNDFYKNWYTKRAALPQFTDVANKRLAELPNVDFQPYGSQEAYEKDNPGTGGLYKNAPNAVYIPPSGFRDPNIMTHEESHYLDFNAPQSNSGVLRKEYNFNDDTLNEIIPPEYKQSSAEGSDNVHASSSIYLPFANAESMPASNYLYGLLGINENLTDYYYRPTEIRARLNEWRMNHNIDPLKDYTNEEMQQIIDTDINQNYGKNFDLYKLIRGRGDLLKKIHDSQVSTGNKENPDEMPKAQRGLRKGENKVKKGKTLFGRPYQIVETEAGPNSLGNERPGETTRVKTVYYKNGNVAKQIIENNENGGNETTWHDKDGKVTAVENSMGYRTFSNGYFDYTNNPDYETSKRRQDESEFFDYGNKLDAFLKRSKLNLENMSKEGSQPGDSYNTVWPDWENDRFNYTRTKNPSIRKSNAKFQNGGLPNDYQDFLDYSETAPENRRPDSEWQYGNPRQYDHYGMWDALGKPKTFEEALAKNPHWQPDPYDGMYHGFSTNPDTGVWLKSHIPGESHPGDTGWMEYKDFMLSNDRNWGGKNQNLVYDPDLQRMRYVERNKQGGTIRQVKIKALPKAQKGSEMNFILPTLEIKATRDTPVPKMLEPGFQNELAYLEAKNKLKLRQKLEGAQARFEAGENIFDAIRDNGQAEEALNEMLQKYPTDKRLTAKEMEVANALGKFMVQQGIETGLFKGLPLISSNRKYLDIVESARGANNIKNLFDIQDVIDALQIGKNKYAYYTEELQKQVDDYEKAHGTYQPSFIERMRKTRFKFEEGGFLPKAQTGFLNNLAAQFNLTPTSAPNIFDQVNQFVNRPQVKESAPSVFDQVNTRIEDLKNVQPTTEEYVGDIFDQYKKIWGTSEPEEKPKEEPINSFTVPEDYYTRLMQEENSVNAGLEDGRYYPYKSPEGGSNTIGYGHKLTPDDVKTNRYSKGLTKEEAIKLMRDDVNMHLHEAIRQYNNKYGKGAFDKLHPDLKVLALDFVYNGVAVNAFPNFFGAANTYSTAKDAASKKAAYDIMMKNYKRHNSKTNEPLPARNMYTESVLLNLKEVGGSMPKAKVLNKSKRKQPGFQVLTDANGKYVFVKT